MTAIIDDPAETAKIRKGLRGRISHNIMNLVALDHQLIVHTPPDATKHLALMRGLARGIAADLDIFIGREARSKKPRRRTKK